MQFEPQPNNKMSSNAYCECPLGFDGQFCETPVEIQVTSLLLLLYFLRIVAIFFEIFLINKEARNQFWYFFAWNKSESEFNPITHTNLTYLFQLQYCQIISEGLVTPSDHCALPLNPSINSAFHQNTSRFIKSFATEGYLFHNPLNPPLIS